MVEWDLRPTKPEQCLNTVVKLDHLIEQTAKANSRDTLVLFTADHSFDLRVLKGKKGSDLKLPAGRNQRTLHPRDPRRSIGCGHRHEPRRRRSPCRCRGAWLRTGARRIVEYRFIRNNDGSLWVEA